MANIQNYALSPNLTITRAITGLWQVADMEKNGETLDPIASAKILERYAQAGLTTFDMADHYGSAEIIAGTFQNSTDIKNTHLLTKWVPKPGAITREQVRTAVLARLKRLNTDRVDLLQFHAWTFSNPFWLDALFCLQELKEEGLIGDLGVTNFDTAHLRIAKSSGVEIVSNQISYSLIDQRGGGKMAEYCANNGIAILAYGTLLGGFLSKKWLTKPEPTNTELSNWSLAKYKRFIDAAGGWQKFQDILKVVDEIAIETGKSISVIASKYQLAQKAVGAVIVGARLGENAHFVETVSLFDFELTKNQQERIATALTNLTAIPGDCGDEYRKPPYLTASGDLSHHVSDFPNAYQPITRNGITQIDSGTKWENIAGYSRAIKVGNRILVSGTTATHGQRAIGSGDVVAQTHYVIDKLAAAIESLGGKLENVIRTRIYVSDQNDCELISRAHGERFAEIRPANTLVQAGLIGSEYLVEIEAEALLP